jgi:hypothetical protein
MFHFVVAVELVEGTRMLVVRRKDRKSFRDGVTSYNFNLEDRAAAEACRWKLEAEVG